MADKKSDKIEGLEFDLTRIGIFEVEDFVMAARAGESRKAAAIMAQCCVKVPEGWGDPSDPATFNRPPKGKWAWRDVIRTMMATVNEVGESEG